MPAGEKDLKKTLDDLLEIKNKYSLDNDKFLLLLGLVNLMGIVNLLDKRSGGGEQKGGDHRPPSPAEAVPFMGVFGGPSSKQ